MIDLEKQADEAERAFIEANKNIKTVDDERRAKELLGEYLNILKLIRLKPNNPREPFWRSEPTFKREPASISE